MKKSLKYLLIPVFAVLVFFSCERDSFITNSSAGIEFSMDTLYFDTVFTEMGTITRYFTIHNPHKEFIRISEIRLAGGTNSVFRMNVDGLAGDVFEDIEIPPKDSIFVFVEATLDPNNADDILLQQDSIVTLTNGRTQDIDLVAWGQDVHFINCDPEKPETWIRNETWINDKPYLIRELAVIDSASYLKINPGVRIYFHRDASMHVLGRLEINGTYDDSVSLQGDRLEKLYEDIPGQWGGVIFYPGSKGNIINYADIKDGVYGLLLATTDEDNLEIPSAELTISNTKVMHMSAFGIRAASGKIRGYNNVFANCGISALYLEWGGDYRFIHCTIANRWLYSPIRNTPSVYISNYILTQDPVTSVISPWVRNLEQAYFGNCIIWGSRNNELVVGIEESGSGEYQFEHCLTRFNPGTDDGYKLIGNDRFSSNINAKDPLFKDWETYDFQLDSLSPAKDAGLSSILTTEVFYDLNNVSRTSDGKPDLGAFERVEEEK
jgi:hypothetical protein